MNKLFSLKHSTLHLIYLFVFWQISPGFIWSHITSPDIAIPYFPHFIVSWIPEGGYFFFVKLFSVILYSSFCILIFYPWSRFLRVLCFLCWLFLIGYESSFAKSQNNFFASTFILFTLIFLPKSKDDDESYEKILLITKFHAVMCYAMAGVWKMRAIPQLYRDLGFEGLMSNLGNTIAFEHISYGHEVSEISKFFLERDYLTGPMFYGLVLLQFSSPLLIWTPRMQIFFGVMIGLFHLLSEVIVHISFRGHTYVILLLFLYDPLMKEYRRFKKKEIAVGN